MTPAPDAAHLHLLTLLTQQRDLYARLQELSDRQRSLICGERPEQLLNILRDRQVLVTALARLNEDLAPFRRDWEATYAALPEPTRSAAARLLAEISGMLRTILQSDHEDGALLAARKQVIARELNEVGQTQAATNAYSRQASGGSSLAPDLAG